MTASLQVGPRLERPPHWRDPGDSRRASLKQPLSDIPCARRGGRRSRRTRRASLKARLRPACRPASARRPAPGLIYAGATMAARAPIIRV